jgi:uncharacterized protein (TIGR02271 family)
MDLWLWAIYSGTGHRIIRLNPKQEIPKGDYVMNPTREDRAGVSNAATAAYFRNPSDAERAISELSTAGISKKDIGVAMWDESKDVETTSSGATGWVQRLRSMFSADERDEYQSHDAIDVLDHMGVPEEQGRYFKSAMRSGGVLVTVNNAGPSSEALSIFKRNNGITTDNMPLETTQSQDIPSGSFASGSEIADVGERRFQLLGETLRVQKERVQTGAVTVRKEVVSERQNIEVPTTREEVVIERHPAEGQASARTGFEDGKEIRVPISEERVKVEKRPIVREEVSVGKRQVQDTRNISDDVKREELQVEKEGDVSVDTTRRRKRA